MLTIAYDIFSSLQVMFRINLGATKIWECGNDGEL